MTILNSKKITKNICLKTHEAPYHFSDRFSRLNWIYYEKPFFSSEIYEFWKFYCQPFSPQDEVILSREDDIRERGRFIKSPIITAVKENNSKREIIGGAWIDSSKSLDTNYNGFLQKEALFHIKVSRNYRGISKYLLDYFISEFKNRYSSFSVHWGKRNPEDDPSEFFRRNGFNVIRDSYGGRAFLHL